MTGQKFLKALRGEFELSAPELALAEAIAASMDRQRATASLRDQRAEGRLQNEMLRTLFSRMAEVRPEVTASQRGRELARMRWGSAAS